MADKKISQLNAATSINNTDLLAIVQAGETKKIEFQNMVSSLLVASNNLSDLTDVIAARANLGVYSTSEVDTLIINQLLPYLQKQEAEIWLAGVYFIDSDDTDGNTGVSQADLTDVLTFQKIKQIVVRSRDIGNNIYNISLPQPNASGGVLDGKRIVISNGDRLSGGFKTPTNGNHFEVIVPAGIGNASVFRHLPSSNPNLWTSITNSGLAGPMTSIKSPTLGSGGPNNSGDVHIPLNIGMVLVADATANEWIIEYDSNF